MTFLKKNHFKNIPKLKIIKIKDSSQMTDLNGIKTNIDS